MDLELKNKTVLVSGASGGIGHAIARQFVAEGARVVVHYRSNREAAVRLVEELGSQNAFAIEADLTDEAQVESAFQKATEHYGGVDILIANAGFWPPDHTPVHEMSVQQWQATMDTNLKSVFLCCRKFIALAVKRKLHDPSIVMIGSTAGLFGEAGHGDYAATKSALIGGFMLTLKNELTQVAPQGRVNVVSPGWVVTPMSDRFTGNEAAVKRALSTIALRKVAGPDDIASAVLFLSSSKVAGHITGQALTVSGGMEGRQLYEDEELDLGKALPRKD